MTELLERAVDAARKLPDAAQDAVAALILAQIDDDRAWDEAFAGSQSELARLAMKAREDIAAGRVRRLRRRSP
jgi:hypothetical protein